VHVLHACTALHACLCGRSPLSPWSPCIKWARERERDSFLMRMHTWGACMLAPLMLADGPCLGTCVHACQDKVAGGRLACPSIFIMRVGWFYQPAMLRRITPSAICLGLFNNACSYNCHSFSFRAKETIASRGSELHSRVLRGCRAAPRNMGVSGPISQATPFVRRGGRTSP
jgi:hypothetical protein